MNVSVNWISALLGRDVDPVDAARQLSMRAVPVDALEPIHRELGNIVVGRVERVERHPQADRLSLCQVNDGTRVVEVVCGASNVVAGGKYPYAPAGTVLPGGLKLEARKIRGVVSHGMLCSPRELELGPDHEGILELDSDARPGARLLDVMPVADTRLEVDVTPNRPDLLGHRGIARELGAIYSLPVKLPEFPNAPSPVAAPRQTAAQGSVGGVEVVIEDVEGCPRYIAAVVRGVTVRRSPAWLQARLLSVGARPINNVVDVTNYILYELNQPLHAFDPAQVRGRRISIRRARSRERLITIDQEERDLTPEMTLICDAEGPMAIGGVMGGADSEVTAGTRDILLECAYFDPKRIRATRKALRMNTEASYRFERGTDVQAMPEVMRRAVALVRAVAGGEEPEPAVDLYPTPIKSRTVFLRPARVAHVLGVPVPREEIERLLVTVGFAVVPKDERLAVQIPGWRPDVSREIDLVEEVARLKGYDAFPVELRPFRPSAVPDDPIEALKCRVREVLVGIGLYETRSLPLVPEGGEGAQPVLNPLSADQGYLRQNLLPGLVRSVERNWAARVRDIRLFEIGAVFRCMGERPAETLRVAGVVSGARVPAHWSAAGKSPDYDPWDLKAMFEIAARLAGPEGRVVGDAEGWAVLDGAGRRRGWAGALSAEAPAWAAPLLGFELDLEVPPAAAATFQPLPTTPPIERDLALVVPAGVTAERIGEVMRSVGGALLEDVTVFDEYRGPGIAGRSVAWRLRFRAPDRTLRDEEADALVAGILARLKEALRVQPREA